MRPVKTESAPTYNNGVEVAQSVAADPLVAALATCETIPQV